MNTYTLSSKGKLYVFNQNRKIEKWMDIKTSLAFGLSLNGDKLICNCANGIIRIFQTETLTHLQTLPKPPCLGGANHVIGVKKEKSEAQKKHLYGDCIAAEFDDMHEIIIAVYSDGMTLIWDVNSAEKPKVMRSFISHKSAITDLDILPTSTSEITKFATCSSDKTVRLWNFYDYSDRHLRDSVRRNIYCKELEQIIYLTDDFSHFQLKDADEDEKADMIDDSQDETDKLKCVKASPDGAHIACGDGDGNIKVFDVQTSQMISDRK